MTNIKIAIIGLGYVGMPLAAAFSSKFKVFGFDLNSTRINELKSGFDRTLELDESAMKKVAESGMSFSTELDSIKEANFFIVTVPTPIDKHKNPDLNPLKGASTSVAKVLKKGDIVGKLYVKNNKKIINEIDLTVLKDVDKCNIFELYFKNLKNIISGNISFN